MITADADKVMISDVIFNVKFGDIPHHPKGGVEIENQCVLPHRFLELIGLNGTSDGAEGVSADLFEFCIGG